MAKTTTAHAKPKIQVKKSKFARVVRQNDEANFQMDRSLAPPVSRMGARHGSVSVFNPASSIEVETAVLAAVTRGEVICLLEDNSDSDCDASQSVPALHAVCKAGASSASDSNRASRGSATPAASTANPPAGALIIHLDEDEADAPISQASQTFVAPADTLTSERSDSDAAELRYGMDDSDWQLPLQASDDTTLLQESLLAEFQQVTGFRDTKMASTTLAQTLYRIVRAAVGSAILKLPASTCASAKILLMHLKVSPTGPLLDVYRLAGRALPLRWAVQLAAFGAQLVQTKRLDFSVIYVRLLRACASSTDETSSAMWELIFEATELHMQDTAMHLFGAKLCL